MSKTIFFFFAIIVIDIIRKWKKFAKIPLYSFVLNVMYIYNIVRRIFYDDDDVPIIVPLYYYTNKIYFNSIYIYMLNNSNKPKNVRINNSKSKNSIVFV